MEADIGALGVGVVRVVRHAVDGGPHADGGDDVSRSYGLG
jgi:hypothetical protein